MKKLTAILLLVFGFCFYGFSQKTEFKISELTTTYINIKAYYAYKKPVISVDLGITDPNIIPIIVNENGEKFEFLNITACLNIFYQFGYEVIEMSTASESSLDIHYYLLKKKDK